VVQEYALAKRPVLICGQIRISGQQMLLARQIFSMSLRKMLISCSTTGDASPELVEHLNKLKSYHRDSWLNAIELAGFEPLHHFNTVRRKRETTDAKTSVSNTLYQLLQTLYIKHDMEAFDPRDRIMGILGLATDTAKLGIKELDYQTPVDLICVRVAKAILSKGGASLLNSAQSEQLKPRTWESKSLEVKSNRPETFLKMFNLPSWVPDWRQNLQGSFETRRWAPRTGKENPSFFAAGGPGDILQIENNCPQRVLLSVFRLIL
jgi:hypothetical protein